MGMLQRCRAAESACCQQLKAAGDGRRQRRLFG